MVNFDAMRQLEDETRSKHLEAEVAYIKKEMIEPLLGCTVIAGMVDDTDMDGTPLFSNPFPVITFRKADGTIISMMVSADDECNEGGRLIQIV
jgi:hypothetical protein